MHRMGVHKHSVHSSLFLVWSRFYASDALSAKLGPPGGSPALSVWDSGPHELQLRSIILVKLEGNFKQDPPGEISIGSSFVVSLSSTQLPTVGSLCLIHAAEFLPAPLPLSLSPQSHISNRLSHLHLQGGRRPLDGSPHLCSHLHTMLSSWKQRAMSESWVNVGLWVLSIKVKSRFCLLLAMWP